MARRALLHRAWQSAGLIAATPLLIAACDGDANKANNSGGGNVATPSKSSKADAIARDVVLINKGILLEQTAIKAYEAAAGLPFIASDKTVLGVASQFMGHHKEHRDTLVAAVRQFGGTPADYSSVGPPTIPKAVLDAKLPDADRKIATLRFARDLERLAAETYHGLIASQLETDEARQGALEIFPTEAMHVAVYDMVLADAGGPVNAALFSNQR